jgi:hypothetical protein
MASSSDHHYHIGPNVTGPGSRWFEEGRPIGMPSVGLLSGWIGFSDGRHRFFWLRGHGLQALPILTSPEEAPDVHRRFGTPNRTSFILKTG